MAVDRSLLKKTLSANNYLKASEAQKDLLNAKDISDFAMNSANFGSGKAGSTGLAAQLGTAGIGAYGQYKAKQQILDNEVTSQQAFGAQFPQYAELASQLSPETRQAYTVEAMKSSLKAQDPMEQLKIQTEKLNQQKTIAETNKLNQESKNPESKFGKAPTGYKFLSDGSLEAISGGPAGKLSAESASKNALIEQGNRDVNRFRDQISEKDKDGKIIGFNRSKLAAMGIYGSPGARTEASTLYNAINARLRIESGTAVPPAEVKAALKTFAPSVFDSDETINSKLDRMNEFFGLAKEGIGEGRGSPSAPTNANNNSTIAEGTIVQNKSGQKLIAKGGKWQPL